VTQGKKPSTAASRSNKNFFSTQSSFGATRNSFSTSIPNIHKHPVLEVTLGPEFARLPRFKLDLASDRFGRAEITESCKFELTSLKVGRVEEMAAVMTVFLFDSESQDWEIYGIKNFTLCFGKEPSKHAISCGAGLEHTLLLTVRLYL
jgi:hypothetical protein